MTSSSANPLTYLGSSQLGLSARMLACLPGALRLAAPIIVMAVVLLLWEVAVARLHVRSPAVPAPSMVGRTVFVEREIFWKSLQPTLVEAAMGFALGNLVALALAAALVRWPSIEVSVLQLSVTVYALPIVDIAHLLVMWLGTGYGPRVVLAALSCFFPTLINASRGFNALDGETQELMQLLDASPWQVLTKARLPAAVPYLFAGFKIGAPAAVLGAILGEWIGAEQGLGLLMLWAMFTHLVPRLWGTVLVSALVATLAYVGMALLERVLAPWASDLSTI
jgi:NitT/TauT family transport system permease protein